jgi:hypothetical protein
MMKRLSLTISFIIFLSSLAVTGQPIKGKFAIKNEATGLLLRPMDANKKDETPIVGYEPVNWKCMTWEFQQKSDNIYNLRNLFTNKTFQPAGEIREGVSLGQQLLDPVNEQQQWEFIPVKKNVYRIRLKNTALYLTALSNEINKQIILSPQKSANEQYWRIYEQDPQL